MNHKDELLLKWSNAAKALAAAKDAEAELRKSVALEFFGYNGEELKKGTENVELGNGYKLKGVFKINRSLNNKDEAVDNALDEIEAASTEGAVLAKRLVKWKPELSETEYNALPDNLKKIIDKVITSKPATPAFEIVVPKAKK